MVLENRRNRFGKIPDSEVWFLAQRFAITVIDEDRAATGRVRAIDVAPAVANEEAAFQIDAMPLRGAQQHAGLRFSAIARITVTRAGMKTNFDRIQDWDQFRQPLINGLSKLACLFSPPDVGLVGDDDEAESSLLEPLAARDRIRRKL